jgi:hypothetical protein
MLRTIRNIVISVVVLLALFVGGGVAYVMLSGNDTKSSTPPTPKTESNNFALPNPLPPNPKAPEGAAVESLLSPATIFLLKIPGLLLKPQMSTGSYLGHGQSKIPRLPEPGRSK